ncbi:hypothetical protein LOC67_11750 [Stieleria sp. JC731]|uniref:hypothetical protein n=1 Tax=Pirellulaceae TaxID=2691357 RepID=UPI001E3B1A76|nr:hypothetical protein [Stieleria sp. JC731]MCC9601221.1 hypothetical protein [Stieleria sp. JC731]
MLKTMLHIEPRIDNPIAVNRGSRKWSPAELFARLLWYLVSPLFRFSPRPFWGWRRFLLRLFGASVGKQVHIHPSAKVFIPWNLTIGDWSSIGFDCLIYNLGRLDIGERVTISQRAHLCGGTHDYRDMSLPLVKSEIRIGDDAWICADAFVGPDIEIGEGSIVAARSVVTRSVGSWQIFGGHPAQFIKERPKPAKDQDRFVNLAK